VLALPRFMLANEGRGPVLSPIFAVPATHDFLNEHYT